MALTHKVNSLDSISQQRGTPSSSHSPQPRKSSSDPVPKSWRSQRDPEGDCERAIGAFEVSQRKRTCIIPLHSTLLHTLHLVQKFTNNLLQQYKS